MFARAENNSTNRANIIVIPAMRHGDMAHAWNDIIGGVDIDPAEAMAIKRNPGVGCVSAGKSFLAGRRIGFQITAHVAGRQTERPEATNLDVGEVLANPSPILKYLFERSADRSSLRIKFKIPVDSLCQVLDRLKDGAAFRKRTGRISGHRLGNFDQWRIEDELAGFKCRADLCAAGQVA